MNTRATGTAERVPPGGCATAAEVRDALAAILEHSNDAIFRRTLDGTITSWNAAAERLFGYTASECLGQSSRLILPPGKQKELRALVARLRRGEVIQHFQTERLNKAGARLLVSLTISPIRDASGRVSGFSTIARDMTEVMRMRHALAQGERELNDLFEEASVGLVVLSRRGRVLRANRAFLELVDRPSDQVVGGDLRRFHPEGALLDPLYAQLCRRQSVRNFPTEFLTSKRQAKAVLVDANSLWHDGTFVHSRWFVRDISRRKHLERELIELSEREKRGFARELHDGLGQQLGGAAYLANVLRETLAQSGAAEATDAARILAVLRTAMAQTRRVARDLSPIPSEPGGLREALRELTAQTQEWFSVRCRFVCRQPVRVPDPVLAAHLLRIAQEAVSNALKHAQPRAILIRLERIADRVVLAVADDGRGIGRLSPRRKGLGLHLMQYRASLVQGTLAVQRRRGGRGTEVRCSAPFRTRGKARL